ncbi:unnamed protein product [Arctogadus glacialis]
MGCLDARPWLAGVGYRAERRLGLDRDERGSFFYPDSLVWMRLAAGGEGVWIQDCRIRPAQNLHGKQGLGRGLGARGETKIYEDFEVLGASEVFGAWEGLGG